MNSSLVYKENKTASIIYFLVLMFSVYSVVYVLLNTPDQPGTGLFFTLPLTFVFCLLFFRQIIQFQSGGYGLKVFYFFCCIRYVLLPYITCQVGSFASIWSSRAYVYAIIIQDIELIVSCLAIRYYYPRKYRTISTKLKNQNFYYEDLSLGGWIVIIISLVLIATRGISRLLVSMRFGVISEALEKEAYYGYDIWMAHTMLAFFAIVVTSYFQKKNDKKDSKLNLLISVIVCMLSCLTTFGNNRMMTVYYALSAMSILSCSYPKYKRILSMSIFAVLAVVLVSFTLVKQYGVDITNNETVDTNSRGLASTMAVYVSSTEAIAKVYDRYLETGDQMELRTIFADIVDKTTIFELPFMRVKQLVKDVTPSYKLAMTGVEVVPVAGQMLYYGGYVFGWILDIIAFWFVMALLVTLEINSKLQSNLGNRYIYTWTSVVCGMIMCYHLGIIYHAFTYVPFFTFIALMINRRIRIHRKKIL